MLGVWCSRGNPNPTPNPNPNPNPNQVSAMLGVVLAW